MLGDRIRAMSDEELAEFQFLVWEVPNERKDPETRDYLPCFCPGCAWNCPHNRRTDNMCKWLIETY